MAGERDIPTAESSSIRLKRRSSEEQRPLSSPLGGGIQLVLVDGWKHECSPSRRSSHGSEQQQTRNSCARSPRQKQPQPHQHKQRELKEKPPLWVGISIQSPELASEGCPLEPHPPSARSSPRSLHPQSPRSRKATQQLHLDGGTGPAAVCDLASSCRKTVRQHRAEGVDQEVDGFSEGGTPRHGALPKLLHKGSRIISPQRTAGLPPGTAEPITAVDAHRLAKAFHLSPQEVLDRWRLFRCYDTRGVGKLPAHEFLALLRSTLREYFPEAKEIPLHLFKRYLPQGGEGRAASEEFDFEEFLVWMTQHSFTEELLLTKEQRKLREAARTIDISAPEYDRIGQLFRKADSHGSGRIGCHEFEAFILELFGVGPGSIPNSRVKSFFRQIDADGRGSITFQEFLPWYSLYFKNDAAGFNSSSLEDYYYNLRRIPHKRVIDVASPR